MPRSSMSSAARARSSARSRRCAPRSRSASTRSRRRSRERIPDASFVAPDGGYFLWVTLPPGLEPAAVLAAAAERGLALVSGDDFVLDGASGAVRLAYSGVTPEEIREGVGRLAEAIDALR